MGIKKISYKDLVDWINTEPEFFKTYKVLGISLSGITTEIASEHALKTWRDDNQTTGPLGKQPCLLYQNKRSL